MSVPLPTLTSEPPVPPDAPPSVMRPLTSVEKLLRPTVSVLEPRKKVPAPSIEPAVMPAVVRPEMSTTPPALAMRRAKPPLPWPLKNVVPPASLMNVALTMAGASQALSQNVAPPFLLVTVAVPAVLWSWKKVCPNWSLMMVELPAVLLSKNSNLLMRPPAPSLILAMVEPPAVLMSRKPVAPPFWLRMLALAAVLVSRKSVIPGEGSSTAGRLTIVAEPAELC
jgi:hypothetical protein